MFVLSQGLSARKVGRNNAKSPLPADVRRSKTSFLKLNLNGETFAVVDRAGARFPKVPIINGHGKLLPFTLKSGVSVVLHLT